MLRAKFIAMITTTAIEQETRDIRQWVRPASSGGIKARGGGYKIMGNHIVGALVTRQGVVKT